MSFAAENVLRQVAALELRARCMNPTCRRFVAWKEGKGRPSAYCGNACRVMYQRRRARLETLARELEKTSVNLDLTREQELAIASHQAKVRWHLARMLPTPTSDQEASG